MHALYLLSVWLHILAATAWLGGMLFLVLVVVPWLRAAPRPGAGAFLRETGMRFRSVGWICFGIVLVTGTFNLWVRGVRLDSFLHREWLLSPAGKAVLLKLSAFAVVLVVSFIHDFFIGPRASAAMEIDPQSTDAMALRRRASLYGRLNALLALVLVAAGVIIVRGWPW